MKTFSKILSAVVSEKMKETVNGCSGSYTAITSKIGVKILHRPFSSIEQAESSGEFELAVYEMECLKMARELTDLVPMCYGVRIIETKDHYYQNYHICILLEHLGSETLRDVVSMNFNVSEAKITNELSSTLKKVGIRHDDLHWRNIMRFKDKWWAIDFDPEFIEFSSDLP